MLKIASLLIFITALAHSYLGERYLFRRLFKLDDLPPLLDDIDFLKGTLRFTWHITTITWLGIGLILMLDDEPSAIFLYTISLVAFISAAMAMYFTRAKHLSWVPLLLVCAICFSEAL